MTRTHSERTRGRRGGSSRDRRQPANVSRRGRSAAAPKGGVRTQPSRKVRSVRLGGAHNARIIEAGKQFLLRHRIASAIVLIAVAVVVIRMVWLQAIEAPSLSAEAASQRTVTEALPAKRGEIEDRYGRALAYTADARNLTFQPVIERAAIEKLHQKDSSAPDPSTRIKQIAAGIRQALGGSVDENDLIAKMSSNEQFVYLARLIGPDVAASLTDQFPEVGAERQAVRLYPGGPLAANIIGDVDFDGNGLIGLESSMDSTLAGTNGSQTYDQGSDGAIIPGSMRNVHPAVNGKSVKLTIDADLQWFVQTQVQKAKDLSGAKNASAVVLDSHTGEVLAMANNGTFNPAQPLDQQQGAQLGDLPVTSPFEPGSVNKIITASAVIQNGISKPTDVHQVPGSINMGGVTVNDAWAHGLAPYTTQGIFGKSSNVGTLMLAQKVGPDRYMDLVNRFGLGQRTNVGLPGESGGEVPPRSQWSGSTFANLPIGQGLSMTLLQMTGLYQTIANDGLRVPPRIIMGGPAPDPVRVVDPQTAVTVRNMFEAVTQCDPTGEQQGTGCKADVAGYQVSGKTGTAQQVDANGRYSNSKYNITFAGIAPADNPRFVIGIMLDNPSRSTDGSGGQSAAPLFATIASWMLQRDRVPLSAQPAPKLILQAGS